MADKALKLNDEYKVKSDSDNLMLVKVHHAQDPNANHATREVVVGYYSKIEQLGVALVEKEIKDNLGDFTRFMERSEEIKQFIKDNSNG